MSKSLPNRYAVEFRDIDGFPNQKAIYRNDIGKEGNRLFMIRGLQKTRADLERKEHPHNHIYLDGAALGPYYDKMRGIFSLDHHKECIRQITDSTCVQGTNLVRTRCIGALGYTILGNDPDADTVLGAWSLLNADLMAHDDRVFHRMQPLMIVEGNIDCLGFGYEELTGLPQDVISKSRQQIQWLMQEERDIKRRTRWNTIDFADVTEHALRKIDKYALYRDSLDLPVTMDVHEKITLKNGQTLHFVQTPDAGIYEVEHTILTHKKDKSCACIIFHDGKSKWTIKLAGFLNGFTLVPIADALNAEERRLKNEKNVKDEQMLAAQWGGGDGIIGAPRYPNGSSPFVPNQSIIDNTRDWLNVQIP